MEIFLIILAAVFLLILAAAVIFFAVTFTLYFFNLDMKLVRVIYDILGKHYDTMKRDKKL
ncbi:MAG: hypothetical protein IJO44_07255 [Clostridia bacterium]|nr:hypothetical protein [Clostridia bacterium]